MVSWDIDQVASDSRAVLLGWQNECLSLALSVLYCPAHRVEGQRRSAFEQTANMATARSGSLVLMIGQAGRIVETCRAHSWA